MKREKYRPFVEGMKIFLLNGNGYDLLIQKSELTLVSISNGEDYGTIENCHDEVEEVLLQDFIVTSDSTQKTYKYKNVKSAYHALQEHRLNLQLKNVLFAGEIMEFDYYFCISQKDGDIWECRKFQ